jgi:hypothetical protein
LAFSSLTPPVLSLVSSLVSSEPGVEPFDRGLVLFVQLLTDPIVLPSNFEPRPQAAMLFLQAAMLLLQAAQLLLQAAQLLLLRCQISSINSSSLPEPLELLLLLFYASEKSVLLLVHWPTVR